MLLLGVIALCSTYGEGAISDWGALHLHADLGAAAGLAAAGYASFALAEAAGRLAGSWLLARLGQTRVLVYGGLVTCAGMLAAALSPVLPLALLGFALAGLGVAIQRFFRRSEPIRTLSDCGYQRLFEPPIGGRCELFQPPP